MMLFQRFAAAVAVLAVLCAPAFAQNGEVQDEHDKQIKADTERNTKYHNNADDYPVNKPNAPVAPAAAPRLAPKGPSAEDLAYAAKLEHARENSRENYRAHLADAQHGGAREKADLASDYYVGYGTPKDFEAAYKLYVQIAAEWPNAEFMAGKMTYEGEGMNPDVERGYAMMTSASKRGDKEAAEYLAAHPYQKSNVGQFPSMIAFAAALGDKAGPKAPYIMPEKYIKKVLENPKKATEGDYEQIGGMYLYGLGVPKDLARAKEMFNLAGQKGYSDTLRLMLAYVAFLDRATNPNAYTEMMRYVDEDKTATGIYLAALAACGLNQPMLQRKYLEKINDGVFFDVPVQAKVDLAVMRLEGNGGPVNTLGVVGNLDLAVLQGSHNAEYVLSRIYAQGLAGVAKDPAKAQALMEAAAKGGQPDAVKYLTASANAGVK